MQKCKIALYQMHAIWLGTIGELPFTQLQVSVSEDQTSRWIKVPL
jgi:hypothetical protein